jgi:glycosyltransferase involved in cell wall biosynthesis
MYLPDILMTLEQKLLWLRKGAAAFADQGLFAASGFLINILLARWLPPEQYGGYALAFSIQLFVSGFYNALLLEPMSVFGPATYRDALPEYLGRLLRLHFAVTVPLGLLVGLGGTVLELFSKNHIVPSAFWGASIAMPWMLFFWLWRRAAYLELRPDVAVRGAAANTFTAVTLLFLFKAMGWLSVFMVFVLQAIAGIVASALLMFSVRPRLKLLWADEPMRAVLKQHWRYGRWVVVTAFVFWLAGDAYYLIIGSAASIKEVAAFRAIQNFVRPVSQFIASINLLLVPWASARFADRAGSAFQLGIRNISMIFTGAAVTYLAFLLFFGRWLTDLVYGGKYTQFIYLVPLMALPILFAAMAEGPTIAVKAMQVPSEVFFGYTAAAIPTILLGTFLTRHWGLIGATLGLATSSFAFLIVISYRYRAKLKEVLPVVSRSTPDSDRKNMRIAWLTPALNRSFYSQPMYEELTKLFPNMVIFTGNWGGFLPEYEGRFAVRYLRGFKYVKLKITSTGESEGFTWLSPSILWELLKLRPAVIFTSAFSMWTLAALAMKMLTECRVILIWDGVSPSVMCLDRPMRHRIRWLMGHFLDGAVSNTREGLEYLQNVLGMPESKLVHYPYLVPEAHALLSGDNGNPHRFDPRPVFLFVGRIQRAKGWRQLLEAVKCLQQQVRYPFSVVLVGSGSEIEELHQLVSTCGLSSFVHVLGAVRYESLGTYFEASDVFVLPTLEDVWGTVIVEGMLFGKPILCSKYAGAKEMVQHGVNGFIFDPCNAEELARYMGRFINEPDLIMRFGAKSSETIAPYTPERAASVFARMALNLSAQDQWSPVTTFAE